jgi:hypothetical protein
MEQSVCVLVGESGVSWVSFLFSYLYVSRLLIIKFQVLHTLAHISGNTTMLVLFDHCFICMASDDIYRGEGKMTQVSPHFTLGQNSRER